MEREAEVKQNSMAAKATVTDPVCRKEVDKRNAAAISQHLGQAFYFCSPSCRRLFSKHPEKYLKR